MGGRLSAQTAMNPVERKDPGPLAVGGPPTLRLVARNLSQFASLKKLLQEHSNNFLSIEGPLKPELVTRFDSLKELCSGEYAVAVSGTGNSGKSTFVNKLLADRVWPVARHPMTSRVCETRFGETRQFADSKSAPPQILGEKGVPKDNMGKDKQGKEKAKTGEPMLAWTPSEFLKPQVCLVDMPGMDQEVEFQEGIKAYVRNAADSSRVVLAYIVDVNNQVRNEDRNFLIHFLRDSKWSELTRRLLVIVNKCDTVARSRAPSDESDGEKTNEVLVEEIKEELKNYTSASLFPMSLLEAKPEHPEALAKFGNAVEKIDQELAKLQNNRFERIQHEAAQFFEWMRVRLSNDQNKHIECAKQRVQLDAGKDAMLKYQHEKEAEAAKLKEQMKSKLHENKAMNKASVRKSKFRMEGQVANEENMANLRQEMTPHIQAMTHNSLEPVLLQYVSSTTDRVMQDAAQKLAESGAEMIAAGGAAAREIVKGGVVAWVGGAAIAVIAGEGALSGLAVWGGALATAVVGPAVLAGTLVVGSGLIIAGGVMGVVNFFRHKIGEEEKLAMFEDIYDKLVVEGAEKQSKAAVDGILQQMTAALEKSTKELEALEKSKEISDTGVLNKYQESLKNFIRAACEAFATPAPLAKLLLEAV